MLRKLAILLICSSIIVLPLFAQKVQWTATTEAAGWQEQSELLMTKYDGTEKLLIKVAPDELMQQIDGFGGCFNERGWDVISLLDDENKKEVLNSLFGEDGCRFNICRMPIGGNDYSMDSYSFDDFDGDVKLEYFSIERDKKYLIPYIKAAMAIKPDLKIWGSPWCPPAWMKQNNHYACPGMQTVSKLRWEKEILEAYANYFCKYVKEYKNIGIPVYAIHVQNEPYACQIFPSCLWTGEEMRDFIRDYLGPQFSKENLDTEIWLGTINNENYNECAGVVMADTKAASYITGVGYQWAGKFACAETHRKNPQKKIMQTESECGDSSNDLAAAQYTFSLLKHYFESGVNSYMYWNMVLDPSGLSTWGWPQNSMISIDRYKRSIKYNMEYYVMKHFSHFVDAGAHLIKITGAVENSLAFLNPNNEIVVVMANNSQFSKVFAVKIGGKMFTAELDPDSFNTFVFLQ